MKIKFGDIVKDKVTNIEGIVYKVSKNGSVTADTALGVNNTFVPNTFSITDKNLMHTDKVDIEKAIRLQCYYAVENMEKTIRDIKDDSLSKDEINSILFNNHIGNVKSKI